ncbi:MAG TPA: hypothetical protein VF730_17595 [Terracidiphilus sp.]
MNRSAVRAFCILFSCLAYFESFVAAQAPNRRASREPTYFSPDYQENDPLAHGRPPSDAVLPALLNTPEARENAGALQKLSHEDLRKIFSVVKIRLSDSNEVDEVALGHDPMSGADNDWFWIVRRSPGRPKVILSANGLSLELLDSRTLGYKNIRTFWSAPSGVSITCIYHYDGKQYRLVHKYTKTVNPSQ